ncbi:MAG: PBSX family phage terminase large subunit [Oscillospiraceae bacterium]|nr:PBSX family phage terminase large subunit [Oscillospiraceae bacterium]
MTIREISEKQLRVLTWWCDGSPYRDKDAIICDGAVRSGKTLFMCLSFVSWAMRRFNGMKFGICGKTIVSLRRNVIDMLLPVLTDMGFVCEDKISKNTVTVSIGGRSNLFHLFGGKDEGSAALIQGITFAGVLLDEVALQPRGFVEQACARCSVTGSKFWFNCNPESPGHWFYREWIKNPAAKNALYLHFSMRDNPSLSPAIRRRYESLYSGVFYQRFVLGQWVAADGVIYDFFDDSYVKPVPAVEFEKYYISCDYGTSNPTSFGLWGLYNGVWYRVKEYYFASREAGYQKTDAEYVEDLLALAGELPVEAAVVDPSAASFIQALYRRGIKVIRADNNVVSGIRITADLLKKGRIVITDVCTDAIREFSMYVWDRSSDTDKPVKENDHAMDEIRYFAVTVAADKDTEFAATYVERKR